MKKKLEKIKKELIEETDYPSWYRQMFACFNCIQDILDSVDNKGEFLIHLKEYLIDYIDEY